MYSIHKNNKEQIYNLSLLVVLVQLVPLHNSLPLEHVCPHDIGDDVPVGDTPARVEECQVAVSHQQRRGASVVAPQHHQQ